MNIRIHPTAIISSDNVNIGKNVSIGPYAIIEENVTIGDGCIIKAHVLIGARTTIGKNCRLFNGAVVGEIPQDLKYADEETETILGDNVIIREYCTIHRGTTDRWKTTIGNNVLIMAYSHIGHDCEICDNVIIANSCNMGGHVEVGEFVIIGGAVPIHQFVKIGKHAFIAGGFRITKDVPPYIRASSIPLTYNGLNSVGLHRRGFHSETIGQIKSAYTTIYRSHLNVSHAVKEIHAHMDITPEVRDILDFIEESTRGIIRG
ncbi:MAG: acyl-ACP--UDP-N-acetylglucosamine O-acyltransferase [Candidatus Marinimicrobia bacterium]|nr:acyl-ACP--UDP-N-acetylglucosamine O-acyltransferase [Candidatus Neomarinimicrobiota bacterium]